MIVNKGSTPLKIGVTGTPPAPIVLPEVDDTTTNGDGNEEKEDDQENSTSGNDQENSNNEGDFTEFT